MNQLFNLIRYIVTKIIFKRGSFTHCILISCAKQLRIFYKNFQTHSGEGIVLCIFIKYTQNKAYMIYINIHISTQNTNTVQCTTSVPPFLHDILIASRVYISIYTYISTVLGGVHSVVLQIQHPSSLIPPPPFSIVYNMYRYLYGSTLTIHEKMRMWDDV